MVWRHRTLAAATVLVILVAGAALFARSWRVGPAASPSVTLDGRPLEAGAREVSPRPRLELVLPPGSRPGDFSAALDGRPLAIATSAGGRSARLQVADLAQGSPHRLEVWRGAFGGAHPKSLSIDFRVVAPLQLAASWLATPGQTTVQVSASRELADPGVVEAALRRGGARVQRGDQGTEGRWPAGRTAAFTIPSGLRATTGAFLPAEFSPALGVVPSGAISRVDLSQPLGPRPQGLKLRIYYVAGPAARASLSEHARKISILSPSFYAVDADGAVVPSIDEQALAIAHAAGVAVEPLVTNKDFSAAGAKDLFRRAGAADTVALVLVAEARRRGYAGYQLDFEGLGYGDRESLSAFSGQLRRKLGEAGLRYSTAVVPSKNPSAGGLAQLFGHSSVYDYPELARGASSMAVMSYDQHTSASDPGPVAGLDWVRQVTAATTAGLDRSRVFMGVPLYYRDWPLHSSATAGPYVDLVAAAAAHDGTVTWDFASTSPYVRYSAPGEEHVAWMENSTSLLAKQRLAGELGFGGVAAWRLGLEDPAFWEQW